MKILINVVRSAPVYSHFYANGDLISIDTLPLGTKRAFTHAFTVLGSYGVKSVSGVCNLLDFDATMRLAAPTDVLNHRLLLDIESNFLPLHHAEPELVKVLVTGLALFMWYQHGLSTSSGGAEMFRMCRVCGHAIQGDGNGPQPNLSQHMVYRYPRGCTNPGCFSHTLEKLIDPAYEKPEADPLYTLSKQIGRDKLNNFLESVDDMHEYIQDSKKKQ
jgi:hypothetical protein